ncbi:BTB domain-containing protein [Fusarium sp. LHS14.1]|nr:BTB domain-containing protein [Fusarium sp. LHS14.1]
MAPPTWEAEKLPTDSLCATSNCASLHSLLSSGDYSDMTIRCRDREFKTHRAIEGDSGIVDLPEDDPDTVESFLEFLYTGTYSVDGFDREKVLEAVEVTNEQTLKRLNRAPGSSDYTSVVRAKSQPGGPKGTPRQQEFAGELRWSPYAFKGSAVPAEKSKKPKRRWAMKQSVWVYVLADKYDVPALRLLARDRFFETGKEMLNLKWWRTASWDETAFFSEIVQTIYDKTSEQDPLRQALHMIIGMKIEDDVLKKRMREEMTLNGELAVGVVDYLTEAKQN